MDYRPLLLLGFYKIQHLVFVIYNKQPKINSNLFKQKTINYNNVATNKYRWDRK
jgi:hypothetical protein